jgi:hypothetical protein
MKIGIAGKSTKLKKDLVKAVADRLGLKKAPDPMVAVKDWKPGGGPLSVLKQDPDKCYYCITDIIGRMQTNDMLKDDFVAGVVYTDVYTMYEPIASGEYTAMVPDLKVLCQTNLTYYNLVAVMPGETLTLLPEVAERVRVIFMKSELIKGMVHEIQTAVEN